ncbi:uncharacterized protein EV422DRAFT_366972 [Fimicolochytrium jonesii]|uniref:uncharacterized protein n=1 Tax=Fimicolochytrium jonesii TaxID=1396493 RepID=UPI0022FEFF48|nr:uncharacterized protein EV422DRAFT_366972 [Fimicolochytrium jonesii]KAI8823711.1 hypothetical protein EV422DRAFT_366972 [Fimicolochytrium jonesii]
MFRLSVPGRTGVRPVLIPPSLATSTIRHFTPTSPSCAAPPAPKWKPTPKSTTTTSSSSSSTYKKPSTSTTTYRPSSAPTTKHNPTSKPQIKPRRTASNPKADASNLGRLPTDLLFPEEDKRVRELYHEAVERMERFDAEVGRVLTGPVREEDLEVDAGMYGEGGGVRRKRARSWVAMGVRAARR